MIKRNKQKMARNMFVSKYLYYENPELRYVTQQGTTNYFY